MAYRPGQWSGTILEVLDAEAPGHGLTTEHIRPFLRSGFPWHEPHRVRETNIHADDWWQSLEPVFTKIFCDAALLTTVQGQSLCHKVRESYINPERWRLFDDVTGCLAVLSDQGWKHVVLSNHVPELRTIIKALGIDNAFEAIFNSAETGVEKPNSIAFQNVLESLRDRETIWMIGDNMTADVLGAKAFGLPSILVRKSHADAEYFCETLDLVPDVLQRECIG